MNQRHDAAAWRRSLLLAIGALLLYGGWAFGANLAYGFNAGLRAFATQGVVSFASTLTITMVMETLMRWSQRPWRRFALSFSGAVVLMYLATLGAHWAMCTPEIFITVLPSLSLGTAYCAIYTMARFRKD